MFTLRNWRKLYSRMLHFQSWIKSKISSLTVRNCSTERGTLKLLSYSRAEENTGLNKPSSGFSSRRKARPTIPREFPFQKTLADRIISLQEQRQNGEEWKNRKKFATTFRHRPFPFINHLETHSSGPSFFPRPKQTPMSTTIISRLEQTRQPAGI